MKRLIAFLILLIHINTSMFIPVADEIDVYDESGMQIGDINTLTDYVGQVMLGHKHKSKHDSDDDQAHFFNTIAKTKTCFFGQFTIVYGPRTVEHTVKSEYPVINDKSLPTVIYDVPAPPPWTLA